MKAYLVRLNDDQDEKLLELCDLYNLTPLRFFRAKIEQEYDSINGNPKLKEMLLKMGEIRNVIEQMELPLEVGGGNES